MGVGGDFDSQKRGSRGFKGLMRRKLVDSARKEVDGGHKLAKELSVTHLIAIGVGSTIGAGVYILVGTVAREHSGPALTISFLIAGIAAALSAFCYAELSSRCPSAGSAYHYSYICVGESVAWLIGWALILEYTVGGSAVARGISPNLALLFGGGDLPAFIARQYIPALDIVVDPCAAILVFIVTGLLCVGIKESTVAQAIVTTGNVCAMMFVVIAGGYLGFKTGWAGYELPTGYFPFGVDGMLAGSATVFFAYIGFDSVASTAEEVKNPQRDLPLGIGAALSISCILYMLVSVVIVGLVPYYSMDPDTPISTAFASHGMKWAAYIITIGAVTALCSTLMGSLLPQMTHTLWHPVEATVHKIYLKQSTPYEAPNQRMEKGVLWPRILMAMARDGLLPSFFSDLNRRTQVPVKATIVTGIGAATLAFFMDVSQLAGMVSVGTLLAFTMVACSVLILRYVPPDEVPLTPSHQESIDTVSLQHSSSNQKIDEENSKVCAGPSNEITRPLIAKEGASADPVVVKNVVLDRYIIDENMRRKIAGWTIMLTCVGVVLLTSAASYVNLPSFPRYMFCGIGGALLLSGLIVLTCIDQDDARHNFGHSGGFICPFVPLLPIACILINVYLLVNLGSATWTRVSIWLGIGVLVYGFYGRRHSSLQNAVYVPAADVDEIYGSSSDCLA
ncbi:Cationic amino acid transporter 2, vacuolar [Vitis vinifera]|uniref:Cationic amino acid transporter 2, vacuolar n=1 Tax=Vitis vinifera TaxID=29760 RepID=A0A438DI76_VITVI|nr:Cationic amino acid transporter 2, vacuolar [Vitis vinifera]